MWGFEVLDKLVLVQDRDEVWTWTVGEPFRVSWKDGTGRRIFSVLAGQKTDLASVPLWARSVVGRSGPQTKAAVVHDTIYRDAEHCKMRRAEADKVLLGLARHEGMGPIRSWIMWACVRAFGRRAWNRAG